MWRIWDQRRCIDYWSFRSTVSQSCMWPYLLREQHFNHSCLPANVSRAHSSLTRARFLPWQPSLLLEHSRLNVDRHHTYLFQQSSNMMVQSILGALFPEAMIHYLENHGPEKFSEIFLGEFDTPEAIWNSEMRYVPGECVGTFVPDPYREETGVLFRFIGTHSSGCGGCRTSKRQMSVNCQLCKARRVEDAVHALSSHDWQQNVLSFLLCQSRSLQSFERWSPGLFKALSLNRNYFIWIRGWL